jgi:hypothetical protein
MLQYENAWTFEHSIDCGETAEFAWNFWTNVSNWVLDADVASVEIDGPFCTGARGFTNSKTPAASNGESLKFRLEKP